MSRRLATRLARIEAAMGVDPVKAKQLQRDVDAELRARVEIEESIFGAELLADCLMRCMSPSCGAPRYPGCVVLSANAVHHLVDIRRFTGECGPAWSQRLDRLLAGAGRSPALAGALGQRAHELLDRCIAELRALDLDRLEAVAR